MAKKSTPALALGGIPRVNLMPPEVGEKRALQARVRMLVRLVILTVVLVAGVYALAVAWETSVQTSLTAAQATSADLLTQQGAFADAKQANDDIDLITEARTVTTSSEVIWADLYAVVNNSLPGGARITTANFTGRAPFDGALVPTSPISSEKVALMTVAVSLASPDDAATFIQSLTSSDLVAGASLLDLNGVPGAYLANVRIDFTDKALSQRFAKEATQ